MKDKVSAMTYVVVLGGAVLISHHWTLEHSLFLYVTLVMILAKQDTIAKQMTLMKALFCIPMLISQQANETKHFRVLEYRDISWEINPQARPHRPATWAGTRENLKRHKPKQ